MATEAYQIEFTRWLSHADESLKAELSEMQNDPETLRFRFLSNLEFGTAGLRGIMGAGTNAINIHTVAQATQGLASLVLREKGAERGVVIAYDSRLHSAEFARTAAEVLAGNGIRVYLFDDLRPTPELSFAIRELACIAGINITASHNPKEYNGYKAYWEDGAQLAPEQASVVAELMAKCDPFSDVKKTDFHEAVMAERITVLPRSFDDKYLDCVLAQMVNPAVIAEVAESLKIVFTPLHGAGHRLTPEALRRAGFSHIYTVEQQMMPDGNFPTVKNPNPEYPEVFALGIELAKQVESDLIVANDPDADRTGIMVRLSDGSFTTLTGNQVGALLLDYIITALEETNTMPPEPYAVKSLVSTELASKICALHGIKLHNVLTGFKFIGEVIKQYEAEGRGSYLFGFEESYGYLKGTYARDKDAVVATVLICEMAAYYKTKNMTLADALEALYLRYGYYADKTISLNMGAGLAGLAAMKALMERMRTDPPAVIGGERVVKAFDYLAGTVTDLATGKCSPCELPKSNVLYYETESGNVIIIRPSGTEPKVKLYFLFHGASRKEVDDLLSAAQQSASTWTA